MSAAQELGLDTHVSLPLHRDEFRQRSVEDGGRRWVQHFDRVMAAARTVDEVDLSAHDDWYLRGNDVLLDQALALRDELDQTAQVLAMAVRVGSGSGAQSATDDFAASARTRSSPSSTSTPPSAPNARPSS
ncbi:MAG: hypothetical protein R2715_21925 [Ilumatobacteraceae bacterium]